MRKGVRTSVRIDGWMVASAAECLAIAMSGQGNCHSRGPLTWPTLVLPLFAHDEEWRILVRMEMEIDSEEDS
jgi:hypothetical protein